MISRQRSETSQCIFVLRDAQLDLRNSRPRRSKLHERIFGFGSSARTRLKLPPCRIGRFSIVFKRRPHERELRLRSAQIHIGLSRFGGNGLLDIFKRQGRGTQAQFRRIGVPVLSTRQI